MEQRLSVIEDTFELSGRTSLIVAPGIPRDTPWQIKAGEPLRIRRPDGSEFLTTVSGIEMLSPPSPKGSALMLGLGVTKEMTPVGSEIWLTDPRPLARTSAP
jgi:hypothetical protein